MQDETYAQIINGKFLVSWGDISNSSKPIIAAEDGYVLLTGRRNPEATRYSQNWQMVPTYDYEL